jgi:hypothetical protein
MTKQASREDSMSRTPKVQTHRDRKRRDKSKVKSMLIIFFDTKGIVLKEFVLVGQTVNSSYYCVVLRRLRGNVRKLRA